MSRYSIRSTYSRCLTLSSSALSVSPLPLCVQIPHECSTRAAQVPLSVDHILSFVLHADRRADRSRHVERTQSVSRPKCDPQASPRVPEGLRGGEPIDVGPKGIRERAGQCSVCVHIPQRRPVEGEEWVCVWGGMYLPPLPHNPPPLCALPAQATNIVRSPSLPRSPLKGRCGEQPAHVCPRTAHIRRRQT